LKRFTLKPFQFFSLLLAAEGLEIRDRSLLFAGPDAEEKPPEDFPGGFPPEFIRDLRFVREIDLSANPHGELCARYCESVYSSGRRDLLCPGDRDQWLSERDFFREVGSFRYYRRFFLEPGGLLRDRLWGSGTGRNLPPPEAFDLGKELLSFIMSSPGPLRFSALAAAFSGRPLPDLADAFFACLHAAAAVLLWDRDLEIPLAGSWPHLRGVSRTDWAAAGSLEPRRGPPPAGDPFPSPNLIEDLESVLLYAAFFGIKIRKSRKEMHKKDREALGLEWKDYPGRSLGKKAPPSRECRIEEAFSFLRSRGFLKPEEGGNRFVLSREGMDWLGLPFAGKLSYCAGEIGRALGLEGGPAAEAARTAAELLGRGEVFDIEDFLVFAVYRNNPYFPEGGGGAARGGAAGGYEAGVQQRALEAVLFSFLLPLGGIVLLAEEERLLFSLTPAGSRLLGTAPENSPFPANPPEVPGPYIHLCGDGRILVRIPAENIEHKLERFCDSIPGAGGPGPEYRVSFPSVQRAAAEGIPLDVLLHVLGSLSLKKVPARLENEIRRWYSRAGRASVLPGLLVDCGTPKGAKKIAAADPRHVRPVGNRFVLVDEDLGIENFSALCRRAGLVITDLRNPGSRSNPGPSRPAGSS
jgi:hypothetical protein